jgi:hypothetical protein
MVTALVSTAKGKVSKVVNKEAILSCTTEIERLRQRLPLVQETEAGSSSSSSSSSKGKVIPVLFN